MRLLARVYAGGDKPSKVMGDFQFFVKGLDADEITVVVKLYEAEIYGEKFVKMRGLRSAMWAFKRCEGYGDIML